jgi:hypothetical protein
MQTIFYTYLYLREDGTPFYVGKGTRKRIFSSQHNVVVPPKERILMEPHVSEADAFEAEIFLIAYYGRKDRGTGCLYNFTDGGQGAAGVKKKPVSAAGRQRMSVAQKLSWANNHWPRKPLSEETRLKISAKLKGNHNGLGKKRMKGRAISEKVRNILEKGRAVRQNFAPTEKQLAALVLGRKPRKKTA